MITASQLRRPVYTAYIITTAPMGLFGSKRVPGEHKSASAMWSAVSLFLGGKDLKKGAELLGLHHPKVVSLLDPELVEQQKHNVTDRKFKTLKTVFELDDRRQREARASGRELIDKAMHLVCPNDPIGLFKSLLGNTSFRKQYGLDEKLQAEAIMELPFVKPLVEQYKISNNPAFKIPVLSMC